MSAAGSAALLVHEGATLVRLPSLDPVAALAGWASQGVAKNAAFAGDEMVVLGKFNGQVVAARLEGNQLKVAAGSRHPA